VMAWQIKTRRLEFFMGKALLKFEGVARSL